MVLPKRPVYKLKKPAIKEVPLELRERRMVPRPLPVQEATEHDGDAGWAQWDAVVDEPEKKKLPGT